MSIAIIVILAVTAVAVVGRGALRALRPVDRRANALEVLRRMSQQPPDPAPAHPAVRTRRPAVRPLPTHRPTRAGALAVVAAVTLAAGILTVALRSSGGSPASSTAAQRSLPHAAPARSVAPPPTYPRTGRRLARPPTPVAARRGPAPPSPSTSAVRTSPGIAAGAAPVITGVTPSAGRAGQVVTLAGQSLFSADGAISVSFGGAAASIACPTKATCRVVVPTRPSHGRLVRVSVTTAAGTSGSVSFRYLG